ncbi:hypothetical protein AK812_SmicGene39362 [Symbiodinium microadriaticum]|uniref:Uncharacterized protein n=1 Tax=Symbiodinium microadriaticum TaxID=2951 RepID=A0A1Q9CBE3_SYMMI|nr:hypothetical protein AK812_SmicGene39362 [Symbiodinium microadriaticum]
MALEVFGCEDEIFVGGVDICATGAPSSILPPSLGDCTFGEQPTFSIHFDPVSVHAGAVEAQLASSAQRPPDQSAAARGSRTERSEVAAPPPAPLSPISLEVILSGVSVQLLRTRLAAREGLPSDVEIGGSPQRRGYDLFTEGSSQKRVKFYGFNAHTFQKCYSYKQMGDAKRKKYDEEVERAIAGQLSSQLVHLLQWLGSGSSRNGISVLLTKAQLGVILLFADWALLGNLGLTVAQVMQAISLPGAGDAPPAKVQEEAPPAFQDLTVRGGLDKLQLFFPSDPEGGLK